MQLSVVLAMGLALLPELAAAAGGFYNSCRNNWYMDGKYMVAECRKINGQYIRTRIDMNLCMTDSWGNLRPAQNGNYAGSCWGCQQGDGLITANEPPTPSVTCICRNGNGNQEVPSSLNLNTFVENRDGYLWCYGYRASPW